jgi:hypothetical protein
MVNVDEIEFVKAVGGSWCLTSSSAATRGFKFTIARSDDGQTFYVTRVDANRTIAVPRASVLWWHDEEKPAPVKGKAA